MVVITDLLAISDRPNYGNQCGVIVIMLQSNTKAWTVTPIFWLLVIMPVNAWPIVRRSENLKLVNLRSGLVGFKGLMTAILYQAWEDANNGDPEALDWLETEAADYCISVNFNHNIILNWVNEKRKEWLKMDNKVFEMKRRLCDRLGLPLMVADMLRGETTEAIKEDAEKLIKLINPYALYIDCKEKEKQT